MALTKLKNSNLDPSVVSGNTTLAAVDLDAANDYILVYDASAAELKQIAVQDVKPDLSAIDQHMIPDGNEVYDLGTAENKWRDLYLSAGTIYLGNVKISENTTDGTVDIKNAADDTPIKLGNAYDTNEVDGMIDDLIAEIEALAVTVQE